MVKHKPEGKFIKYMQLPYHQKCFAPQNTLSPLLLFLRGTYRLADVIFYKSLHKKMKWISKFSF